MGEARRTRQAMIDRLRKSWDKNIPLLRKQVLDLGLDIQSMTGDEPYYWELVDQLSEMEDELATDLALSTMTDKDLLKLLSTRGYL